MNRLRVAASLSAFVMWSAAVEAQAPSRVRGTITAIDGNVLSVKSREGQDLRIDLAPNATFAYVKRVNPADIKPGTPLGTTTVIGPDGKLVARELHLFTPDRPIPNEGQRPSDLEPESTMTNARVTAVVEANRGRELTLTFKGSQQQVIVPPDIPIVTSVESDRSLIVVGEYALISVTAAADGKLTATRLQITKDGVRPPN